MAALKLILALILIPLVCAYLTVELGFYFGEGYDKALERKRSLAQLRRKRAIQTEEAQRLEDRVNKW